MKGSLLFALIVCENVFIRNLFIGKAILSKMLSAP